ncbi:MAG: HAD family phosphatase [Duncaniella sp.]|nr:HAD family phosphatase [Duncaniella sp.]
MIKNLIFDFGKVLVDYDFMALLTGYFGEDTERLDQMCRLFLSPEFIDRCDREAVPFSEIIREEQKNHPELADGLQFFHDRYADFVTGEVPGMKELLYRLKANGYRLYGLTNWNSVVHEVMRRYESIFGLLDGRVISSEEHFIKPEREIYECLCSRYGLDPSECLFADDKAANVEGALKAGMNAVVFTDAARYINDLETYGVKAD